MMRCKAVSQHVVKNTTDTETNQAQSVLSTKFARSLHVYVKVNPSHLFRGIQDSPPNMFLLVCFFVYGNICPVYRPLPWNPSKWWSGINYDENLDVYFTIILPKKIDLEEPTLKKPSLENLPSIILCKNILLMHTDSMSWIHHSPIGRASFRDASISVIKYSVQTSHVNAWGSEFTHMITPQPLKQQHCSWNKKRNMWNSTNFIKSGKQNN